MTKAKRVGSGLTLSAGNAGTADPDLGVADEANLKERRGIGGVLGLPEGTGLHAQ